MKTEYIPKITTLLAGAIVCIISIVKQMDTTYSLAVLLAVLVVFYIIGCIARRIIENVMISNRFMKEQAEESEEETDSEEDDDIEESETEVKQ